MKPDTLIHDIRPKHTLELRRLFVRAVDEDFSYFPDEYRGKVLSDNNLPRLVVASLRPSRILVGARQAGRMIGYVIAGINGDESGKIYWLYVSPEGRGLNLGQSLLRRSMRQMHERGMRRVSLVTHDYTDYYKKFGFSLDKAQQLYGVDMKVMSYTWPN